MTVGQLEALALGAAFHERYEVTEKLGEGGFGDVYKARQIATGQAVAVKVLRIPVDHSQEQVERLLGRFQREMRLCAALHHPNIIRLMDSGKGDGRLVYSVFSYVPGKDLASVLAAEGRLSPGEARHLLGQVLDALACAHAAGVVHRDLKPENIMVVPTGARRNAVVLDFGIGSFSDGARRDAARITGTHEWIGSPAYAAPEQLRGQPPLPRSDLYAWGLVFLECLTGRRAVAGDNLGDVVFHQLSPKPVPIPEEIARSPLGRLLKRATEKEPEARDVTAEGLLRELEACDLSSLSQGAAPSLVVSFAPTVAATMVENTPDPAGESAPSHAVVASVKAGDGERRQVTTLCCTLAVVSDARGSDIDDLDPILRAEQDACVAVARRLGGHFAGALSDTMLFFFGYPAAREDDARRAARVALTMLAEVRDRSASSQARVELRIGVHTGMIVTRDAPSSQGSGSIGGSTPRIASRLCALAAAGEALISGETQKLLRGHHTFEPRAAIEGAGAPIDVHRLLEGVTTAGADVPLAGRRSELASLLDRWERMRGGAGQAALISGEPGIGKSRLARALRDRIGAAPHTYLEARCDADAIESPLHPIVEMLDRKLDPGRELSPAAKVDRLSTLLAEHGFTLAEAMPLFAQLLSLPAPDSCPPLGVSPQKQREMTLDAIVSLLFEMGERAPLLLFVEDLHWADPSTLELSKRLVGDVASGRICAVFTARSELVPPWPLSAALSIHLGHLDRADVAQMAVAVTGGRPLAADVIDQIASRTDGVPLFVEELIESMLESGALVERSGGLVLAGGAQESAIPHTLRDLLTARLDRLGAAKETAQVAAVIGREVGFDLLRAVRSMDEAALREDLEQLATSDLVHKRRRVKVATYVFKHALIQDTAYDTLVKSRRREIHERVARTIERNFPTMVKEQPEVLARHLERAGRDEEATRYLVLAGARAMQRSAFVEATALLSRGVEIVLRSPGEAWAVRREIELRAILGGALVASRGYAVPELEANGLRALELCRTLGEPPELFPVLFGLWLLHVVRGESLARTEGFADELCAIAEKTSVPDLLLTAHHARASTWMYSQRYAQAREGLLRALSYYDPTRHLDLARTFGDDHGVYAVCYLQLMELALGHVGEWRRYLERTRELVSELRADPLVGAVAALFTMLAYYMLDDRPRMEAECAEALRLATAHGLHHWGMLARIGHGLVLARRGEGDLGLTHIRAGMEYLEANGQWTGRAMWTLFLVEALLLSGRIPEALQRIDDTVLGAEGKLDQSGVPALLQIKGMVLGLGGDMDGSIALYRRALAMAKEQVDCPTILGVSTVLAKSLDATGEREEARACLSLALANIEGGEGWTAHDEGVKLLATLTSPSSAAVATSSSTRQGS